MVPALTNLYSPEMGKQMVMVSRKGFCTPPCEGNQNPFGCWLWGINSEEVFWVLLPDLCLLESRGDFRFQKGDFQGSSFFTS